MKDEAWFLDARQRMVREQIERRGIRSHRLLEALRHVPRHHFVPPELADRAYEDGPLSIGSGQTISQPYIVAAMTDLLELSGGENVLEVGTGSGYQAAVLGEMAASVHSIELHPELAWRAQAALKYTGYENVFVHTGDGTLGWPAGAPYHAILVTAAAPEVPRPLLDQLIEGGRRVIPVGGLNGQELERWQVFIGIARREDIFPVAFVPLRGQFGWQRDDWYEVE